MKTGRFDPHSIRSRPSGVIRVSRNKAKPAAEEGSNTCFVNGKPIRERLSSQGVRGERRLRDSAGPMEGARFNPATMAARLLNRPRRERRIVNDSSPRFTRLSKKRYLGIRNRPAEFTSPLRTIRALRNKRSSAGGRAVFDGTAITGDSDASTVTIGGVFLVASLLRGTEGARGGRRTRKILNRASLGIEFPSPSTGHVSRDRQRARGLMYVSKPLCRSTASLYRH